MVYGDERVDLQVVPNAEFVTSATLVTTDSMDVETSFTLTQAQLDQINDPTQITSIEIHAPDTARALIHWTTAVGIQTDAIAIDDT